MIAPIDWDNVYKKNYSWEQEHSSFAERILDYVDFGSRVADIGCGSGRNAGYFTSQGFRVVAIDNSITAIRKANKQFPGINFLHAEGEALPLLDNSQDATASLYVLNFTSEPLVCARELARITKPGGIILLSYHHRCITGVKVTECASPDSVVEALGPGELLGLESFVENISAGSDPHEGDHAHDCVRFIYCKH